jgi:arsenate reductase
MKVYTYKNCSTCRDAVKWLREHAISFEELPIRETPPSLEELRAALVAFGGDPRPLFNTSGQDYRALGLKDKLPAMSADEALALLAANGNLVKRPFVIDSKRGILLTGFKPAEWQQGEIAKAGLERPS